MKFAIQLIAGAAVFMATEYVVSGAMSSTSQALQARAVSGNQTAPAGRRHQQEH